MISIVLLPMEKRLSRALEGRVSLSAVQSLPRGPRVARKYRAVEFISGDGVLKAESAAQIFVIFLYLAGGGGCRSRCDETLRPRR